MREYNRPHVKGKNRHKLIYIRDSKGEKQQKKCASL